MPPTIRPRRWVPPHDPGLTGRFAPTGSLASPELWRVPGAGPEDVVVDPDGRVWTGLSDGRLVRFDADGAGPTVVAELGGGQILGVELLPDGRLLCCQADRGLVAVDPVSGAAELLLSEVDGRPLVLTNNAAVRRDGTILFTESTRRFRLEHYELDLLEQSATGSLWCFDPGSGEVDRLHAGLCFANGVALTADEDAVLVAETGRYAIHRVPLEGPDAGRGAPLVSSLPGMPDNLSTGPDGTIWCALPSLRLAVLDALYPRTPVLRRIAAWMPKPGARTVALVIGIAPDGTVRHVLHADGSDYAWITGVREHAGWLYLSALHGERALARVRLPA